MKPIYKSLVLANMVLAVTLSLHANVTSAAVVFTSAKLAALIA